MENLLELRSLSKTYTSKKAQKKALNDVSFTLGPGLYGLLGPNGAGKSTMMNIITGNLDATEGKVLWNGKDVRRLGKQFRRTIGYMPQIPRAQAAGEAERTAALVHLSGELDKRLSAYSGGMKQRLLAAAALLGEPRLLILDEPTAGLDPKERVRLRQVLEGLAENCVILVATHVVSDVEHVANGILLLKDGRLVSQSAPAALVEEYAPGGTLEDVYLSVFGEDEV